jgi:riboflavin synthase
MFGGIVQKVGLVVGVRDFPGQRVVSIGTPARWHLAEGESVAVEGVCSTVQAKAGRSFRVVYMNETLRRTTLGSLEKGHPVNLERSLRLNGIVGGHLVQGHVDTTAGIWRLHKDGQARIYEFVVPARYLRYIVEKGSVAIDGISLTVAATTARGFRVSLLEYTLKHTTLGAKKPGDRVNIEVDLVARYLAKLARR